MYKLYCSHRRKFNDYASNSTNKVFERSGSGQENDCNRQIFPFKSRLLTVKGINQSQLELNTHDVYVLCQFLLMIDESTVHVRRSIANISKVELSHLSGKYGETMRRTWRRRKLIDWMMCRCVYRSKTEKNISLFEIFTPTRLADY